MMSTAYYSRIDPAHPAAFSGTVVSGMVRGDLGFDGVVVSDDLGQARQVAAWSYGDRALQFLAAGGDLVLTVQAGTLPPMYDAVLARARADAGFRARVEQAALRVLRLKQAKGLLPRGGLGAIGATYQALGGPGGFLGQPLTPQYPVPGGVEQDFTGGELFWSPTTGTHYVRGGVLYAYRLAGGPYALLGLPTTDELAGSDGVGRFSAFRGRAGGGTIWWTPRTGAHAVYGAILDAWARAGGPEGRLGYPIADEADALGGRGSVFQHGRITWQAATNTVVVTYT